MAVQFTPANGKLVLKQVRICFEPSAFDGSDTAKRSIVFEVPEENKKIIQEWEANIDPTKLSSTINMHGIRTKMDPQSVRCWHERELVALPENMRGATCNAILEVHGVWNTKNQSVLSLACKDIDIIPTQAEYPF